MDNLQQLQWIVGDLDRMLAGLDGLIERPAELSIHEVENLAKTLLARIDLQLSGVPTPPPA